MATLLHIKSSPRGRSSVSGQIAGALLDRYQQTHPDDVVDTIELSTADLPVFDAPTTAARYAVLAGRQPTGHAEEAWTEVIAVISRFKAADKLVMSSPMWNFSIPYRLKHYIDLLVQPGLTFSRDPLAGHTGLVTGRPAAVILARGSDHITDPGGPAYDFQAPYLRHILGFIGFEDIQEICIEPTQNASPETAEAKVQAAMGKAHALADRF